MGAWKSHCPSNVGVLYNNGCTWLWFLVEDDRVQWLQHKMGTEQGIKETNLFKCFGPLSVMKCKGVSFSIIGHCGLFEDDIFLARMIDGIYTSAMIIRGKSREWPFVSKHMCQYCLYVFVFLSTLHNARYRYLCETTNQRHSSFQWQNTCPYRHRDTYVLEIVPLLSHDKIALCAYLFSCLVMVFKMRSTARDYLRSSLSFSFCASS